MSNLQLSLSADQAYTYYHWLHEVLAQPVAPANLPIQTVMHCAAKVYEKLHTKTMLKQDVKIKLSPELQTSLQHLMLVFPPPAHYTHMGMVIELVKGQLPPVVTYYPFQPDPLLEAGPENVLVESPRQYEPVFVDGLQLFTT